MRFQSNIKTDIKLRNQVIDYEPINTAFKHAQDHDANSNLKDQRGKQTANNINLALNFARDNIDAQCSNQETQTRKEPVRSRKTQVCD